MPTITLLPLDSADATLERVGGKGANLARLARAGFPVPPGFLITTAAYRAFVAAHGLDGAIAAALAGLDATSPAALDQASAAIRAAFAACAIPDDLQEEIRAAYAGLREPPVAVRSSATAEDLPDLSFAGQQETVLNIRTGDALLHAIVACWSSLWTARAIGYRARNAIDPTQIALAVVVQEMVQSEVSGVLFTANPLTGLRTETVIDATIGLGEALVSGQVEPDHYVVETQTGQLRSCTLGAKALSIRSLDSGGVVAVAEEAAARQALPNAAISALTALGARVAAEYGGEPQDIEWAWAEKQLFLLQARPVTSLFPIPPGIPADELAVFFSFGAVQGMLDPMTPLGQETFRHASASFARVWGYDYAPGSVPALHFAAERMWLRFDALLHNGLGRTIFRRVLSLIEAGASHALEGILESDPRLAQVRPLPSPTALRRIGRVLRSVMPQVFAALRDPDSARTEATHAVDAYLAAIAARAAAARTLEERVALAFLAFAGFSKLILTLAPPLAAGMGSFYQLLALADKAGLAHSEALEATRGLPHNVTTEMDLALWQMAHTLQQDPATRAALAASSGAELAQAYATGQLPPVAQTQIDAFLARYGMRGVGEIDLGRPRWREEPTQVFQMVQNYAHINDDTLAPDAVFARGAIAGEATVARLVAHIEAQLGKAAGQRAAFFGRRMRALTGMRETPKFFFIRIMGIVRAALLESFRDLAARGVLEDVQDGFFLTLDELRGLDAGYQIDWKALVRERRALYDRERRRRQIPHLLLSDGRAFYGGAGGAPTTATVDTLSGSPVSPGVVEGVARIVLNPHDAHLNPGDILVCPGTDPAWTPLFLSAGGLVMEVGGMMTHGSVVAREYGIPAVAGVTQATERLHTGDRIRVDGSTGRITRLEA